MTAYTMQELERLAAGQGENRQQERFWLGNVPYHPPPLKRDVDRAVYNAVYHAGRALSRRQIADMLGLEKTTWLNEAIEGLVGDGYLTRSQTYWQNGVIMYYYEVAR